MGSKTPVSILQEMCIRKSSLPHYELIHDGGATHEPLFKYQVVVGELSGMCALFSYIIHSFILLRHVE
jgi:dsRNA-specific ribonuclease